MVYTISDVHGHYNKYSEMLEKINFSDKDTLYILGDVIDRGNDGIRILLDILRRPNVVMLMGNHEAMMLDTLLGFEQINEDSIDKIVLWVLNGGGPTLTSFLESRKKDRINILNSLEAMPYYIEIEVCGSEFVLLHGGLENFSPERPLCNYSRDEIVWAEPSFENGYFSDKFVIVGHTPTPTICDEPRIFLNEKLIDIDCGCAYEGGRLGCLCLDNFEEFYV